MHFLYAALDTQPELYIHITPNKANNTITLTDSGIGMTKVGDTLIVISNELLVIVSKTIRIVLNLQDPSKDWRWFRVSPFGDRSAAEVRCCYPRESFYCGLIVPT
jgi:hypothetical protein